MSAIHRHVHGRRNPTETPILTRLSLLVQPCRLPSSLVKGLSKVHDLLLFGRHFFVIAFETAYGVTTEPTERNTFLVKGQTFTTKRRRPAGYSHSGLRGDRAVTQYTNELGKFHLNEIPHGVPLIDVTFGVDAKGILNVSAQDESTGKPNQITISNEKGRLSQDKVFNAPNAPCLHGRSARAFLCH